MKRIAFPVMILFSLFLVSCAPSLRVYHDLDANVDFSAYKTFSFTDWTEGNKKTISQMELQRIRDAVEAEMENKGMKYVDSGGDLSVAITVFHREAVQSYNYPYGMYSYYGPVYSRNYHFIERAVSLDMFETSANRQVWHSAVVGAVDMNPQRRAENMPKAAEKLLKDFPVGQ